MNWLHWFLVMICLGLATPIQAACAPESCPVLVIDYTGNLTSDGLGHADQFAQTVLPEAVIHTIGNHGVVPDARRGGARYSEIIRTDSAAQREDSVAKVLALTRTSTRTVLAFDMNELIPNQIREQLRQSLPAWLDDWVTNPAFKAALWAARNLPNKTDRQADVAAEAAARWKAANPGGKLVIRGHSDGTYSVLRTLKRLHALGIVPDAVVLESPRQQYDEWMSIAKQFPGTVFIDIAAKNDFAPAGGAQRSPPPVLLPNWRHLQLTAEASPMAAHSAVADLFHIQAIERTDRFGTIALNDATLGAVLQYELKSVFVTAAQHMLRNAGLDGRTPVAPAELARLRREAQADLDHVARGAPVWRDAAVQTMNNLFELARQAADQMNPSPWGRPPDASATAMKDLAAAVKEDIEASRGKRFVVLRSHTLEKIGDVGLDMVMELGKRHGDTHLKRLAPAIENLDEIRTYVRALSRIAGGRLEPEEVKMIVDATASLVKRAILLEAELEQSLKGADPVQANQALGRLRSCLLLFDVVGDFAQALAVRAEAGQWTIEAADLLSDALINAGATLFVLPLAASGKAELLPYARDAVATSARFVRDASKGSQAWSWLHSRTYGNRFAMLDAYAQYQFAQVRRGLRALDIDQLFGTQALRAAGFTDREVARSKDQNRLFNTHTAMQAAGMKAAKSASPDRKPDARKSEIVANEPEKPGPPTFVQAKKPGQDDAPLAPPGGRRETPNVAGKGPDGGGTSGGGGGADSPCGPGSGTCGGIDLGLTALVIDPATRKIVALAEGGMPQTEAVDPALLALALWLEYTGQRAAFSLDPYDPKDPQGPWLRAVYFPEALRGTVAGNQCFEADFLLKQMSFGVRVEGDRVVERRSESGLLSVPELMSKQIGPSPEQWSRLWIVSREVRLTASDGIVRVGQARMGVEARRQVPDPSTRTGLRDVATPADATEQRFARQFEQLYDKLSATEAPSLAAVREVTKAIAIARWMRMNDVRIDMEAVVAQLNRARVPAVEKVSALSVDWTSQTRTPFLDGTGSGVTTTTRRLHVFGGVDLSVAPKLEKSRRDDSLREAVASRLRQSAAPAKFELSHARRTYRAYVMPILISGGGER